MTATVFLVLLAGHLLGDWQAATKTRSWAALAAHVATYHLVMGPLLLLPILRDGWPAWRRCSPCWCQPPPTRSSTGAGPSARC